MKVSEIDNYESWIVKKGYKFTQDWFSNCIPLLKQYLNLVSNDPVVNALEIGSWEGRSTCWLLDNILTDELSKITCVDTFKGIVEYEDLNGEKYNVAVEHHFDYNIQKTGSAGKVRKLVGRSQEILRSLPLNFYDLVYIDGSHYASDVLSDAILVWELAKVGSYIIFDDYNFEIPNNPKQNTSVGVDAFIRVFQSKIHIIHQAEQVLLKKISL